MHACFFSHYPCLIFFCLPTTSLLLFTFTSLSCINAIIITIFHLLFTADLNEKNKKKTVFAYVKMVKIFFFFSQAYKDGTRSSVLGWGTFEEHDEALFCLDFNSATFFMFVLTSFFCDIPQQCYTRLMHYLLHFTNMTSILKLLSHISMIFFHFINFRYHITLGRLFRIEIDTDYAEVCCN